MREVKKKNEREEQLKNEEAAGGEGNSAPGEQGDAKAKAAAEQLEVPVRDTIAWCLTAMSRTTSSSIGQPAENSGDTSACVPPS